MVSYIASIAGQKTNTTIQHLDSWRLFKYSSRPNCSSCNRIVTFDEYDEVKNDNYLAIYHTTDLNRFVLCLGLRGYNIICVNFALYVSSYIGAWPTWRE